MDIDDGADDGVAENNEMEADESEGNTNGGNRRLVTLRTERFQTFAGTIRGQLNGQTLSIPDLEQFFRPWENKELDSCDKKALGTILSDDIGWYVSMQDQNEADAC